MSDDLGNKISSWRSTVGLNYVSRPENTTIKNAITLSGAQVRQMGLDDFGEHLIVLESYYTYLSAHMGQIFSRVQYTGDSIERIKLNQIKPFVEAIKVKIDLYKKIYDRKVSEVKWRAINDASDRS